MLNFSIPTAPTISTDQVRSIEFSGKYLQYPGPIKITLTNGNSRIVALHEAAQMALGEALIGKFINNLSMTKAEYQEWVAQADWQHLGCIYVNPRTAENVLTCVFSLPHANLG